MKVKYALPKRSYCDGNKKMVSFRLPERLWNELEVVAENFGWTTTDVVTTALDQFAEWAYLQNSSSKKKSKS